MIRFLHISCPTNRIQDIDLFEFVLDVYFNHINNNFATGLKFTAMRTRQGVEVIVDDAAVVSLLLSKAGFSVRDLGKVSV